MAHGCNNVLERLKRSAPRPLARHHMLASGCERVLRGLIAEAIELYTGGNFR